MMKRKIKKSIWLLQLWQWEESIEKNIYNICMYYNEVAWFDQNLRI